MYNVQKKGRKPPVRGKSSGTLKGREKNHNNLAPTYSLRDTPQPMPVRMYSAPATTDLTVISDPPQVRLSNSYAPQAPVRNKILSDAEKSRQMVRFNVSGRKFRVLKATLQRLDSPREENALGSEQGAILLKEMSGILGKFASEQDSPENGAPSEEVLPFADAYFPESGEFFFERSPDVFEAVLAFYRTGALHCPPSVCWAYFVEELRFWQLPQSLLSPCCANPPKSSRKVSSCSRVRPSLASRPSMAFHPNSESEPPAYYATAPSPRGGLAEADETNFIQKREKGPEPDQFEGVRLEKLRRGVWDFMEDPASSRPAKIFSLLSVTVVLISVLDLIVGSLQEFQVRKTPFSEPVPHPILQYIEMFCIVWFTAEYIIRLIIVKNRMEFIKTPLNIVDCLSVLPFYLELGLDIADIRTENFDNVKGALLVLRILRVLRVARIFKLAKYSGGLQSFGHTLKASYKEIWMLVLFMSITIVLFSTTVYFLEKDLEGTKFTSIPATFWWCIVTMTTVGYGDITPQTVGAYMISLLIGSVAGGKLVASLTSVSGVIVLAFPITIIVENFNKYYRNDPDEEEEEEDDAFLPADVGRTVYNV